jgi:hypothetical protein
MLPFSDAHEILQIWGPHYVIHSADLFRPIIESPLPTYEKHSAGRIAVSSPLISLNPDLKAELAHLFSPQVYNACTKLR